MELETHVSTVMNSRTQRTVRAGLQSLMILLGTLLLLYGLAQLRDHVTPISSSRPAPEAGAPAAQPAQGFLPMVEAEAASELVAEGAGASARSAAMTRLKLERLVGAAALGPSAAVSDRPVRLVIPDIHLNAPIVSASLATTEVDGQSVYQWAAPNAFAAGWHHDSATLGQPGNTVINGHHNAFGEVFRDLNQLEAGDRIFLYANEDERPSRYEITRVMILKERFQSLEERADNARWIRATEDERVTLVTCWPYESNTHRMILIARPLDAGVGGGEVELE